MLRKMIMAFRCWRAARRSKRDNQLTPDQLQALFDLLTKRLNRP